MSFESFIEVKVTQPRLEYLRDTWHDHPLSDFAKDMLNACVVQNAPHTGITEILNTMSRHKSWGYHGSSRKLSSRR